MPAFLNVADFLKVGILAFVFVWAANRILTHVGLEQFKA